MDNINPPNRGYDLVSGPSLKDRLPKLPLYIWIFIFVLLISLVLGGAYLILSRTGMLNSLFKKGEANGEKNISEPFKPSPKPLASGRQTYLISGSKVGAPKVSEVVIDPIDPQPGANQKISAKALSLNNEPITEVSVTMITDNKKTSYPLKLISGTNLDGVWEGSWNLSDSYLYTYQAAVKTKNAKDEWEVTLTFR